MNKIIVTGKLTHTPKKILYKKPDGYMTKIGVAVHDRGTTIFLDLKVFKPDLVNQVCDHLDKGRFVEIEGHFEKYQDSIDFVADEVIFGDKKEVTKVVGGGDDF